MKPLSKLHQRVDKSNSVLCIGPDADITKLPSQFLKQKYPQFEFSKWIIEQTHEYVCAFKPNLAFFEATGDQGIAELKMTMEYLQEHHQDIFTIADAKRADIGSTNEGYVKSIFDWFGFDAVTLHPYLGQEALQPFLEREDKVSIILCRTSNPGAPEFQDLKIEGKELWRIIAEHVSRMWNIRDNCMLVVGATYPEELAEVRKIVGEMTLLIPGIGAQGGDIEKSVKAGMNSQRTGLVISTSRAVIFASDPKQAAQQLSDEINQFRV
ncbi:MAG: orotidine-5'-phosphate decarboxylase [Patescibacteria group bacterium]